MIASAEEFVELRRSERQEEYSRVAQDSAPREVWLEVIQRFPDMRFWVAQNKTVPVGAGGARSRSGSPRAVNGGDEEQAHGPSVCAVGDRSG